MSCFWRLCTFSYNEGDWIFHELIKSIYFSPAWGMQDLHHGQRLDPSSPSSSTVGKVAFFSFINSKNNFRQATFPAIAAGKSYSREEALSFSEQAHALDLQLWWELVISRAKLYWHSPCHYCKSSWSSKRGEGLWVILVYPQVGHRVVRKEIEGHIVSELQRWGSGPSNLAPEPPFLVLRTWYVWCQA